MSFNGPPSVPERSSNTVETPEYWKGNHQFVYPKGLFEVQFAFAKIMAEREGTSVIDAIGKYAPLLNKTIRTEDEEKSLLPGVSDKNALEKGYAQVLERRKSYESKGLEYFDGHEAKFGCFYYRYKPEDCAVEIHFFNAEAEEEFVDGKDISKGPLKSEKIERRRHELADMFKDIKDKYPDATQVRCLSHLNNLEPFTRLFPDTFEVGDIDYDPRLWFGNTDIWGQFLGGNEKEPGEYGFKDELVDKFLEEARAVPLDKLADAVENPPRTAVGPIQDFYDLYGVR